MDHSNQTLIKEFILIGFTWNFQACVLLFVLILIIYTLTILGNVFLIFTVLLTPKLHTPMYYFLCNLSFLDLCFSSTTSPKLLSDLLSQTRRISLLGCIIQMYCGLFLGSFECTLLAVMAYDRYIAICSPVHYTTIMSWRVCRYITVIIATVGLFVVIGLPLASPFVFCREDPLNHFACELLILLEVACGDLSVYKITIFIGGTFSLLASPAFIVVSYISIIISILKIRSVDGRAKAFSTCASHLTVVVIFFGTSMTMYMGQAKGPSANVKYMSFFYSIFVPVLNPLIYSLRNNEVKGGFQKMLDTYSRW